MRAAAIIVSVFFAFAFLLGAGSAAADQIEGRVVGVTDGDTITVLTSANKHVRIRLVEIDAPESNQPWGQHAKQTLSGLIFGKHVTVTTHGVDQYSRTLGRVFAEGKNINSIMVQSGDAWAYREYLTDYSLISDETLARKDRRGLWSLPENQRMAPWEWRVDSQTTQSSDTSDSAASGQCGAKRYCRQMTSCAEARYYLNQCGVASLDGDHDGVPCEKICR